MTEHLIFVVAMFVAAFAGGIIGAAIGSLPAFVFTGFMVIAGEAARIAGILAVGEGPLGATGITAYVAFGAFFGPHIAFAGGAAASAYAGKKGYMGPDFGEGWGYHDAKNILIAFSGKHNDTLLVGGLFGMFGYAVFYVSANVLAAPWDPIAMGVVLSALAHRVVFRYDVIGHVQSDGFLDISPFDREEVITTDGTGGEPEERLIVEPWLPWYRDWSSVTIVGFGFGVLGGLTFWATGSPFLAFGVSAATLVFLNLGIEEDFGAFQLKMPVTHHVTLPASTAPMAYAGLAVAEADPETVQNAIGLPEALILGVVFGVLGALLGELAERIFYAHGDTHWDPPATSIVVTTFLIAVLAMVGIFPGSAWVPTP